MLATLLANTEPPYRLVVVDGGAPRRIARELERLAVRHDFTLVRRDALLTSNEARNLGLRHVDTRYAVFVDNDTIVPPGWLAELEQCADETAAPLVAPVVLAGSADDCEIHAAGGGAHIEGEGEARRFVETNALLHHPPDAVGGARRERSEFVELHCLLTRVDALREIGPFDEGLIAGREHSDLVLRVAAATGDTPVLEPAVIVRYASKRLTINDWAFFLPRWSDEWATASFAHFNEKWMLRDTSVDAWFLRGALARRLRDQYRSRAGARLWAWRMVRRARRVVEKAATAAALAAAERRRADAGPARIVHRASWCTT
jgi:GT2 family glycosyltransferase